MLLLFQKDLCRNCPASGHLAEVTVSQAGEGMQRREGWKEWKKVQKVSEQMEAKERIDVEEERLMEVQGGGESLLLHNLSLSLSLILWPFFFSHSDMSIQLCFINRSNYEMCCQGNYTAHQRDSRT